MTVKQPGPGKKVSWKVLDHMYFCLTIFLSGEEGILSILWKQNLGIKINQVKMKGTE